MKNKKQRAGVIRPFLYLLQVVFFQYHLWVFPPLLRPDGYPDDQVFVGDLAQQAVRRRIHPHELQQGIAGEPGYAAHETLGITIIYILLDLVLLIQLLELPQVFLLPGTPRERTERYPETAAAAFGSVYQGMGLFFEERPEFFITRYGVQLVRVPPAGHFNLGKETFFHFQAHVVYLCAHHVGNRHAIGYIADERDQYLVSLAGA